MLKAKAVLTAVAIVGLSAGPASAADITTKRLKMYEANAVKQEVKLQSKDLAVTLPTGPDAPTAGSASLYVYGDAPGSFCYQMPKTSWEDKGTKFKFKDGTGKALIRNGKLQIKLKGPLGLYIGGVYTTVNAIFRSGSGYEHCMKCTPPTLEYSTNNGRYKAKDCAAAACDAEPGSCEPASPSGAFLD